MDRVRHLRDAAEDYQRGADAELNMMSVAAGLALGGKIPVAGTYGVFAAGRPWDQIRTASGARHWRRSA
jgi:transketolase C-terminal domain/subunit